MEQKSDRGIEIFYGEIRNEAVDFEGSICRFVFATRDPESYGEWSNFGNERSGMGFKNVRKIRKRENESAATGKLV